MVSVTDKKSIGFMFDHVIKNIFHWMDFVGGLFWPNFFFGGGISGEDLPMRLYFLYFLSRPLSTTKLI